MTPPTMMGGPLQPQGMFLTYIYIYILTNYMIFSAEIQLKQVWQVPEPPPVPTWLPMTPLTIMGGPLWPQHKFLMYIYLFFDLLYDFFQQKHS